MGVALDSSVDPPGNDKQRFTYGRQAPQSAIDMEFLAAPIKSAKDKFALVPEFLKVRGLVKQHLDSFNYFVNTGIKKIVRANNRIESEIDPTIYLEFKDIYVDKASVMSMGKTDDISPNTCRLSDMTYAAPIKVDIVYIRGSHDRKEKVERKGVTIGRMPIMLQSCCCTLLGKNEAELAKLGECPLDPGGYFIIKGNEKVLLMQEQLSKNRIIIDMDKKGNFNASVTSSSERIKSKTVIQMENQRIYLILNQFAKKIPIMVVMKALGMTSDQEVVQMVGRDPRYGALLMPSLEDCAKEGIYTQEQALDYLESKLKRFNFSGSSSEKDSARVMKLLRDVFLANVLCQNDFRPKCVYVAVMLRRIMDAVLNKDAMDDKDYVGNKRIELSGQLISLLFEDLFKTMITDIKKIGDNILSKRSRSSAFDFAQQLTSDRITNGLERTLSTGNFNIKRFKMDSKGMSQVLFRLSYIGCLGHMTRVKPQFEKTRKVSGPRALQPSQWGMLCPCDTPEGEQCGLVKNLSLMAHVTTDEEEGPLMSLCKCLGIEGLEILSAEEVHSPYSFLVFFNGNILGKHKKPHHFANALRKLRRAGKIGEFVSVFVNEKQRSVYIASDGGRVCRPLVIADKGIPRVKEHHMQELKDGVRTFNDFLTDGLIEYLDVNEENNALIALYENEATTETTHIEIEPFTILGVIAGLIPYPHHNQSPRNTYQCAMGKQAMGNIAYNQLQRMDMLYLLVYPQRPLLTTKTIELVGFDKLGAGQNATVAVMSYSGYDIEDAIVMNKASLDRGFGRCILMKKFSGTLQKYENDARDRIARPYRDGPDGGRMRALDSDGLAAPGEIIRNNDILMNKQVPQVTRGPQISPSQLNIPYGNAPVSYKGPHGESCVVDKVTLSSDKHNNLCSKFLIRHTRRPEVEKFRFSAEFIEMRRQALDVFVNRIASHHELQQSEDLRTFLQADEETMERLRFHETGIFKKPADWMQIFKDVQSKVSDVVLGKEKPVEESNPEYEKLKHYIFELENHLAEAQKHAYRLVKRHRELGQSLGDFGKAAKLLGACEGNALGKAFTELGAKSETLSIKLQKEAQQLLMNFEEPLKDYVRAVQSIKATIAERANAFRQQCELAETIKLKEINLDKLMLTRSDRVGEAEHEYKELKAEGEEATRRFETMVRLMNEEIVRFQEQKTTDMGVAFHEFAKGQARLANSIADAWRSLLPKLESCSPAQ